MKKLIVAIICIFSVNIYAQQKAGEPVRTEEIKTPAEAYDEDMASSLRQRSIQTDGIQFGGWLTQTFYDQWDEYQTLIASSTDIRVWAKAYLWQNMFLYLRAKDTFSYILDDEGYGDIDESDNLIDLDAAYAGAPLQGGALNIYAGRKFFTVGTGLALNGRGDGAQADYYSSVVNLSVFSMYTGLLREENNPYGLSSRDMADGSKRMFTGVVASRGFSNQNLYIFGLLQFDMQDKAEEEKTKYDSQYWGAGARGIVLDDLTYYGEFIFETGQAYNSSGEEDSIAAYALNAGADYYFNTKMNPTAIFQYATGSGDKDRSGKNPGGNTSDSDNGFIYFGTYSGGYGLKPYLMNMHVVRAGLSVAPMSGSDKLYLSRMYLIFKYSLYLKDKTESPTSDSLAYEDSRMVGHGLDLAYKWIIYSDISAFLNMAMFMPGSAYPSGASNKYFIFGGFNIAF